jgi:hypothetical protein
LRPAFARELVAPAPLAAVGLMALDDHLLKRHFPGAVTGKLSDVAICFFLPLLLSALLGLIWPGPAARRLAAGALAAAALFVAQELSADVDAALAWPLERLGLHTGFTRDPSDLWALLAVPVAWLYGHRRLAMPPDRQGWLPALGRSLALAATVCLLTATTHIDTPRCPGWVQPLAFRVEGDCGPPGTVVIEENGQVFGAALGPAIRWRIAGSCDLLAGGWTLTGTFCPTGDADAGAAGDAGLSSSRCPAGATDRVCKATGTAPGPLTLSCVNEANTALLCQARLTVLP